MNAQRDFYEFGAFRIDVSERQLMRQGKVLPLTPKAFDVLLALVENPGRTVEKDDLMNRVWPDIHVEEVNLANNISLLRRVLGEGAHDDQYIQTVPRRGYRFVAGVKKCPTRDSTDLAEVETGDRLSHLPAADPVSPSVVPRSVGGDGLYLDAMRAAIAFITLFVIAAGAIYLWLKLRPSSAAHTAPIRSIAVLPFKPLTEGTRDEVLEMGMTDTLITRLSSVKELAVRPMSAVRKYTGLEQDALAAGREQNVDAVLEGTIQKLDNRIRTTTRLLRIADGRTIWTDKFDEKSADIFNVQDAVAKLTTEALALNLTSEEKTRLTKRYTDSVDAYQFYIQGRYFWNRRTPEGMKKAVDCFQQAIKVDPNYALAYSGLADSYAFYLWSGLAPQVWMTQQKISAEKALELDELLAEAHATMAYYKGFEEDDYSASEREFRRSIELNPNYPTAHHWYSNLLSGALGRCDESLVEIRRAQELDPMSLIINATVGKALMCSGRIDEAITQLNKTLQMDSSFMTAHRFLGIAYTRKKMYEEALVEFEKGVPLEEKDSSDDFGYLYAVWGKRDKALAVLNKMKSRPNKLIWDYLSLGEVLAALGDTAQALENFEIALQAHPRLVEPLKRDWMQQSLQADPRFADLLRRYESKP